MTDPFITWELPSRVSRLKDLAYNLWWSWHPEARTLFKEIDRKLWRRCHHNPVYLLQHSKDRLLALSNDAQFISRYDLVMRLWDDYLKGENSWFRQEHSNHSDKSIAYFSAEFGVHNSLRIYSGGLGILAADHCKAASDLGVPLVGVGFMYPQGYVQQRINSSGWQENDYETIDWGSSPVRPVTDANGRPQTFTLELGSWKVRIGIWKVVVGRIPLYLMDTDLDGNSLEDRSISGRLYGGDRAMRLRQEIVLGVGGIRMLRALNIPTGAYHINEGHAAFLGLELLRELVSQGRSFEDARAEVTKKTVFTTHTPVEAGHDVFDLKAIGDYFKEYWPALGITQEQFLSLARVPGKSDWNMTALAIGLSGKTNGVSRRHGEVSRQMWAPLWEGKSPQEVPIDHITNGVHLATWVQQELGWAFSKVLGANWMEMQDDPALWSRIASLADEELWKIHCSNKEDLLELIRNRSRKRWMEGRSDRGQIAAQGAFLDGHALTIGFARRFATYKRADLILRDLERIKKLLFEHNIQIIFAGKSHPADEAGKKLIQRVNQLALDPAMGGHIAFVEDYDMHVARYLVHGCDVWLNNPLAPLEACGTSGMKAAVNGVLNLSILDGWWEEGFNHSNGWAIGEAGGRGSGDIADAQDAEDIYQTLEKKIVPLFYDRSPDGVPHGWVKLMKESIRSVAPQFSANRMVKDYVAKRYLPAMKSAVKQL